MLLTKNFGDPTKQFVAGSGSHVSFDDVMFHEVIGIAPCIEQVVRIFGTQKAFLIPPHQPVLYEPADNPARVSLFQVGTPGQLTLIQAWWFLNI